MPSDGNCLFHAVLYQLGTFDGTVDDLRQMVAFHLDSHRDFYVNFVSQPVESSDPLNADNEPLDMEDLEIARISNSVLRAQKVCITRLKAGAWGDHVCVAAMANMFSATINVFKATDQHRISTPTGRWKHNRSQYWSYNASLLCWASYPAISPAIFVPEGIPEPSLQPCVPPKNQDITSNPVDTSNDPDVTTSIVADVSTHIPEIN